MSYYDDYDDEYSSDDEIYYHNYSVDYANQILDGHHAVSSCLPRMHRRHRRHSPQLVRVSTLDQIPIINRQQIFPSLHSQPKYGNDEDILSVQPLPTRLPSLEATSEELERRATRRTQPTPQVTINNASPLGGNNDPSSETAHRPMTEAELRQVQQQQEAFQQHLLNMQRHLVEQTQEQQQRQEQQVPTSTPSPSCSFKKRTKVTYHDLERDDDQAQIAELIENDPYFAAAMEDFAHTHGLLDSPRHRTSSNNSSSRYSPHSYKRHRALYSGDNSCPSPSSSSSASVSSLTNVTTDLKGSNTDLILFRELHGIRRLMEEYVRGRTNMINPNQPTISIMPVPWPMTGGPFPTATGVYYPPVAPVTDYRPSMVPREQVPPPEPGRVLYQNVVNTVKEVMDRRSPSQREQPLKPSQIDPSLKYVYTKRPRIPSSNFHPTSMPRTPFPPLPPSQPRRRRSSQMSTPPMGPPPPPPPPPSNIPPAPPYEPLSNLSSSRSILKQNRNLSYGNRDKQSNTYDTLLPGHYLRLYTKYNK